MTQDWSETGNEPIYVGPHPSPIATAVVGGPAEALLKSLARPLNTGGGKTQSSATILICSAIITKTTLDKTPILCQPTSMPTLSVNTSVTQDGPGPSRVVLPGLGRRVSFYLQGLAVQAAAGAPQALHQARRVGAVQEGADQRDVLGPRPGPQQAQGPPLRVHAPHVVKDHVVPGGERGGNNTAEKGREARSPEERSFRYWG